jgi:hypothetical protein
MDEDSGIYEKNIAIDSFIKKKLAVGNKDFISADTCKQL